MNVHPSASILLYLCSALVLPGLNAFGLTVLAAVALLFAWPRRFRCIGLLWRARWLFLLLGIGYAYSLPGPAVLALPWDLSPSMPGVRAGLSQMGRLALLLVLLDVLLVSRGNEALMSGLYGLFRLLAHFGFPAQLATVRIGLTLRAIEEEVDQRIGLADLLAKQPSRGADMETTFVLPITTWRYQDAVLVIVGLLASAAVWLV